MEGNLILDRSPSSDRHGLIMLYRALELWRPERSATLDGILAELHHQIELQSADDTIRAMYGEKTE